MYLTLILLALAGPALQQAPSSPTDATPTTIRMVELDGDGWLDRLALGADGSVTVALNRGARLFEPVVQELPNVFVTDVLAADLDADGHPDLYLVSPSANVALLGDGTGCFVDATTELGLCDASMGLRAERVDLDADGVFDLLLHNERGDVVFWGSEAGVYEREPAPDELEGLRWPAATVVVPQAAKPSGQPVSNEASDPASSNEGGRACGVRRVDAGTAGGTAEARVPVPTGIEQAVPIPFFCARSIEDMSTGDCLLADSTPTIGRLYPLSEHFNVDALGRVGVGTMSPGAALQVVGSPAMILSSSPPLQDTRLIFSDGPDTELGVSFIYLGGARLILHSSGLGMLMRWDRSGDVVIPLINDATLSVGGGVFEVSDGEVTLQQEVWSVPALQNGWVNYGAGYTPSGYFVDSQGMVHLRGLVRFGTVSSVSSGNIFTLPDGYRPGTRKLFSAVTVSGVTGRVDVLPTGEVRAVDGSNTYLSLEGITFRVQ